MTFGRSAADLHAGGLGTRTPATIANAVAPASKSSVDMNSGTARHLFLRYAGGVAYVATQRPDGTHAIGTAFHVGEGVFITARHVLEGATIREIGTTEWSYIEL